MSYPGTLAETQDWTGNCEPNRASEWCRNQGETIPAQTTDYAEITMTRYRGFPVLAWLTLTFLASLDSAAAQGVCDRTPQVRDKLMEVTGVSICEAVTSEHLDRVTVLDLSGSGITSLQTHDFGGLSSLQSLWLYANSLSELPDGVFRGLGTLKWLSLGSNSLSQLPEEAFSGLGNLQQLDLGFNQLSEFSVRVFSGLNSLQNLSFDSNLLRELPDGVFRGLGTLKWLSLGSNSLSQLPEEAFSGLNSLQSLSLNSNLLRELPEEAFNGLSTLQYLDLSRNSLSELPEEIFNGLSSLEQIRLNLNPLVELPGKIFRGLSSLDELSLRDTRLRILPKGIFDDVLDTLGTSASTNSFEEGLELGYKATLSFTWPEQAAFEGTTGKVRVILSQALPVAIRAPFSVGSSATTDNGTSFSPSPDEGLLFLAGEISKEITVTLPEGEDNIGKTIVLKLGALSQIGLLHSDGTGPEAPYLKASAFLHPFDKISAHTITISDSEGVSDTRGVCGRTPQVRYKLMEVTGVSVCSDLTAAHLADVDRLDLHNTGITMLQADDFSGLGNLTNLSLNRNFLQGLPDEVFSGLSRLESLQIWDNVLSELPEGIFSDLNNLQRLGLSSNRLRGLPEDAFSHLNNLQRLGLGSNHLRELPEDAFSDLGKLEFLYLHANLLTSLPEGVSRMRNLQFLELSNNYLNELPKDAFNGLSSLRDLSLGGNALRELPEGVFSELSSLEALKLGGNLLRTLPEETFHGLDNLEALTLVKTPLAELPVGIFSGRSKLKFLNFSSSSLTELPEKVFHGLGSLRWLNLNRNRMKTLPEGVFTGLINLEALWLSGNGLRELPQGVFRGLNSMKELDLTGSRFRSLPKGVFDDILDTLGDSYQKIFTTAETIFFLFVFSSSNFTDPIPPRLKARLTFASHAQRMTEGATVRIPVTLSRALPVAVRVPYTMGVSGIAGGIRDLWPAPDRGLLFPAGETRKEIVFHLPEDGGDQGDSTVVLTLGNPSEIGLRRSDGTGPDAPYLPTKAFLIPTDEGTVHTVMVTDSDTLERDPYCLSLWPGSPCSTTASLPHVFMGPLAESVATTEVVITYKGPEAAACEAAVLFHRGTSQAPPVSFNDRFLDSNLLRMTIPQGGARILTLADPDAEELVAGAVSVFARSPCSADSLHVQGRTLLENKIDGEIEEMFTMATQSPGDWMADGDCRVLTGVFGNGHNVGFATVTAEPGQAAPSGTRLDFQAFDLEGNFTGALPGLEISGDHQSLTPWSFDQPRIIEMCLDVPGKSRLQLAVAAIGSKTAGGGTQFVTERFPTESESEDTAAGP